MRILHTADLHIQEKKKETIDALEEILRIAEENKVDVITFGGDIFHSPKDADILRPTLRKTFQNAKSRIIAIPGNHDGSILSKKFDFGFEVIYEEPFGIREIDDVAIVGVPYRELPDDDMLLDLKHAADNFPTRLLLLHCTLDWGQNRDMYGGESQRNYFPISQELLSELKYDFVLAGHFHSIYETIKLDSGIFVYPGSPVSLTWKELGKRHVAIVDTSKRKIKQVALDTFYYDSLEVNISPFQERTAFDSIKAWYDERSNDNNELMVVAKGAISIGESDFQRELEKLATNAIIDNQVRNVQDVLNHPLFKRFNNLIDERDDQAEVDSVRRLVLRVMSSLLGSEELRL
ncbi:MAG: DNA repair exonuclease [Candidatus Thorarchaeota archaeon]|nr:DNA repair exonuclease [Candidatus Thorarchaeota archaeon]